MATNEGIWISRPRVPKISKVLCEKKSMFIEIVRYGKKWCEENCSWFTLSFHNFIFRLRMYTPLLHLASRMLIKSNISFKF